MARTTARTPTPSELGAHAADHARRSLGPVVGLKELRSYFAERRRESQLPAGMRFGDFLKALLHTGRCTEVRLSSPEYAGTTRYVFGKPNPFVLGCAIRDGAYLSHATALELHGLAPGSGSVYVNKEQSAKPPLDGVLSQDAITRAFANNARVSNYVLSWKHFSFVLLSGKNTGRLGVATLKLPGGGAVDVTSVERTLVDATVRPSYCGGVEKVASAYEQAKERVDSGLLIKVLQKLEYVYPYHQAIGFYMQRAGYPEVALAKIRALGLRYDFYLTNKMQRPAFSPEWRIYHPRGL